MTKAELETLLRSGEKLMEMFDFGPGQECEIFKANCFEIGDGIIYIPDISLNELQIGRPIKGPDEMENIIANCYTGKDFVDKCCGNQEMAKRLFLYCDWQHPSSAVDEIEDDE